MHQSSCRRLMSTPDTLSPDPNSTQAAGRNCHGGQYEDYTKDVCVDVEFTV